MPNNEITSIKTKSNDIWVGTSLGVFHLDTTTYTTFNSPLRNNSIHDIAFGSGEQIWFATDRLITILTLDSLNNSIEDEIESFYSIYPNPANTKINISSKREGNFIQLSIYNTLGELIKREKFENNSEIDISELKPGIYLIKIYSDNFDKSETHFINII